MKSTPGYSGRQLSVAKCAIIAITAAIAGPHLANGENDGIVSTLAALIVFGGVAAAYELLGRAVALALGRIWTQRGTPETRVSTDDPCSQSIGGELRLWHVLGAFGLYFGAQVLVWAAGATIAAMRLGPNAGEAAVTTAMLPLMPVLLPASVSAGGAAIVIALRRWARLLDAAGYAQVLSLRWGTRRQLLAGAVAGVGLGLGFLALINVVAFQPTQAPSLVAQSAVTAGPTQWAWMISALLLAPPIEEILFRGVLFGGLAKTWSLPAAALVTGSVFWLMHAPEWLRYWPAAVALALMTIAVTVLRIRSRAVGPCIAAHFGYNLVLVLTAFGWSGQAA